jgi:hypothetical protein
MQDLTPRFIGAGGSCAGRDARPDPFDLNGRAADYPAEDGDAAGAPVTLTAAGAPACPNGTSSACMLG